jgi:rhamnosyltransferase
MDVDVIIPVYKPGQELLELLNRLNAQTVRPKEILLMNTEEQYMTPLLEQVDFGAKYPNVRIVHLRKEEFDHGGTRRRAVELLRSPIFIMMTQDAMPADRHLLEHLTEALTKEHNPKVAVVCGRQLAGKDSSILEHFSRKFNYPEESMVKTAENLPKLGIRTYFCSDVCAAYIREIYEQLGGFVPRTLFNEDMIYAAKAIEAGYGVGYEASARVIHSHNYTNMQQLHRNFDLGVSQAEHPEVFGAVRSESEGKKLVKEATRYLVQSGRVWKLPHFYLQCAFKYAGYLLGKNYRKLPKGLVLRLTTNPGYFKNYNIGRTRP